MKKILFVLTIITITIVVIAAPKRIGELYGLDPDPYDIIVRDVEIVDSQLMDQILLHVTSDSVKDIFKRNFFIDIDFAEYQKRPKGVEVFTYRRIPCKPFPTETIATDLIVDEIKDIIQNKDTVNSVIICFSNYTHLTYQTKYFGKTFYFMEESYIDDKPIFKLKSRRKKVTIDLTESLFSIHNSIWVPFIYHNGRLFIEPEEVQWHVIIE